MSTLLKVRLLSLVTVVSPLLSCGADNKVAPAPQKRAELAQCRSFEQLMPRFVQALDTGRTEGLRQVLKEQVLASEREGVPSPIMELLRSILTTFGRFARQGPERGAPPGQVCAVMPPPIGQSHPLCELRRALDSLVHDGGGLRALKLVDPMVSAIFNYIIGKPPSSSVPHYEVSTVLQKMCAQNAVCQLSDTLDLASSLLAFSQTDEGRKALDNTQAFLHNPALAPYLTNNSEQYGGEAGVIALTRVVLQTVQGMDDPADLDALPTNVLPESIRSDAQRAVGDLKLLLDPRREPNVLKPLKKVTSCLNGSDPNLDVVRMFYRLWFDAKLADFSFANFVDVLVGLRDTDSRGTLVHLARTLVSAVREDEQGVDSAAKVCQVVFAKTNAQRGLPNIAALFNEGVFGEAVCAADVLVYGCAGGTSRPACP